MDMWTTASEDAEAEQMAHRVAAARVSVTDVWPFLAAASSEADYANRKAMVVDRLDAAVAKMLPSDPVAFSVVRASLETSLDDDYRLLAEARQVEAADSSKTCAVCGAAIERDPEGEDNRGWHHADGSKHQHEAMPFVSDDAKNSSPSKQGYPKSSALSTEAANSTCRHCNLKINRDATGMWVDHNGHDACKVNGKGFGKGHQPNAKGRWGSTESSLSVEAETTAQPGEVKHLDNGAYQRSTCKNCGGQIRRQNSFSSGWQHSKNNSKYCPDETKESVLRWADAGIKAADLKSKVADFTDQTAYDWGYEKGSEARNGNPDKHLTTDSDTWSNEGGLGGPINWQTSDGAFPRGFRDGLAGNPKQSSLQTEAGTAPAAANDATPPQGSEPSQGTVQRRVDQDPDTGEFVGSEWAPKEGDPNTLVQTDATFNKNPRFKTQDAANAWSSEVSSDDTDDDADANADAPADDDAKDTTKPDPANSKMPAQFEKKKQSSVSGSRDPFVSSPVVVVGGGGGAFYGATGGTQTTITVTADTAPPYYIEEHDGKYVVVNDEGKVKGTFDTKEEARAQQSALYANVPGAAEKAKEDHGDPKPKVQSAKTARATQVVYQGTSPDQVHNDGGPTLTDLEPLIGKNLTIVFFNEYGVAADYESGRITAVHALPHDEVEFDWDRGEGYVQPTNAADVYQIMRVEEPTDADQMSLFSSKVAFVESPVTSVADLKVGEKVWFNRSWMHMSADGVVASINGDQANIKGVPAHGTFPISNADLAAGNWVLRHRAMVTVADQNPYGDANPYMGQPADSGAAPMSDPMGLPETTRPRQAPDASPAPVVESPEAPGMEEVQPGDAQQPQVMSTLVPVLCHADGHRFTVEASALTADLRCVCGSDDLDLDDPAYCADCFEKKFGYEPDMGDDGSTFADGTCANCGKEGTVFAPDEGMERYLNKDSAKTADVVSDPAANLLGDVDAVTEKVTCSTCFTDHTVTATDPAQPMPACPNCGAKTLSPAGSTLASVKTAADLSVRYTFDPAAIETRTQTIADMVAQRLAEMAPGSIEVNLNDAVYTVFYSDMPAAADFGGSIPGQVSGTYQVFAGSEANGSGERLGDDISVSPGAPGGPQRTYAAGLASMRIVQNLRQKGIEEVSHDPGFGETVGGESWQTWMAAGAKRAKVRQIMQGIRETNPEMDAREAMRVAKQTIQRFPQIVGN